VAQRPIMMGLDLDGVFADFYGSHDTHGFVSTIVQQSGVDHFERPFVPTTWDFCTTAGYLPSQIDMAWTEVDRNPTWWDRLHPFEHTRPALAMIQRYTKRGVWTPVFLTSRPSPGAHYQSVQWLERHGIVNPQVIICRHAHHKAQMAAGLELSVFVDDNVENVTRVDATMAGLTRVYLVNQPYNVHETVPASVLRIQPQSLPDLFGALSLGHVQRHERG
jgi:hypothetical protein